MSNKMNSIKDLDKLVIKMLPATEQQKSILQRRANKLKKDPKGFLEGSLQKRSQQIRKHIPIKYSGTNNFTVVSAVYNVESYLEDYFQSLINQSLNFKKHIQLIMVDDGSTDSSAIIIKKWQKKYPKNIRYLYKKNGGQSSARNLGLEYVTTEWVTFIDPDDFLDNNYFKSIDDSIVNTQDLQIISCNTVFYMEKDGSYKDKHPLNYRFHQKQNLFSVLDLGNTINLSAAASFFRKSIIDSGFLQFDEKVKPNFEDGKFIVDYLLAAYSGSILFLREAQYFYRKRSSADSTLDAAWSKKEKFLDVLEYGFIPMLESYESLLGFVPLHIQRTALYDISWYIKYLLDHPNKTNLLTKEDKIKFKSHIKKTLSFIDTESVLNFNLAGIWFMHKVGILGAFKHEEVPQQITYIENVDREKNQILISYFTYFDNSCSVCLDGIDIIPDYRKVAHHTFVDDTFVQTNRLWITFSSEDEVLTVLINNKPARITLKSKQHHNGVRIKDILEAYQPSIKYQVDSSWILMDRDTQADDNAEHLYRYIRDYHPEQEVYFALNRDSHDWNRLYQEGFNLLEFGSKTFENHLRKASKVISSHLDKYVNNYFGDEYEFSKKFVFLQHGVTKDDMSSWFNSKKNLQCLVTATYPEYESIVEDGSKYHLTSKEVVLTGFPRYDGLLKNNNQDSKLILIMPTWRQSIVGEVDSIGNSRKINNKFIETSYAQHWKALLQSEELRKLVKDYNYEVIFAPHANIEPYLNLFEAPSYINLWQAKSSSVSMQSLFQNAKFMITDYSSVAFEMGFLGKTVLYYQFDYEEVYAGGHIIRPGYFNYDDHGFGPVSYTLSELLSNLQNVLDNEGKPTVEYAKRIQQTFAYRDMNNCQRVYKAIIELDKPEKKELDTDILEKYMQSAYDSQVWSLSESRSRLLLQHGNDSQQARASEILIQSLFNQSKYSDVIEVISNTNALARNKVIYWKAKIAYAVADWEKAINLLDELSKDSKEIRYMYLNCYSQVSDLDNFTRVKSVISEDRLDSIELMMIKALELQAGTKWHELIEFLEYEKLLLDTEELSLFMPELLLSKAYRLLDNHDMAHQYLVDFERHSKGDPRSRIGIARLAFVRENYHKCLSQYDLIIDGDLSLLAPAYAVEYIKAFRATENFGQALEAIKEYINIYNQEPELHQLYAILLTDNEKWEEAVQFVEGSNLISLSDRNIQYTYSKALYRLGRIDDAFDSLGKPNAQDPYEYWKLASEMAILQENHELEKYCYRGMISIYPDQNQKENWEAFRQLVS